MFKLYGCIINYTMSCIKVASRMQYFWREVANTSFTRVGHGKSGSTESSLLELGCVAGVRTISVSIVNTNYIAVELRSRIVIALTAVFLSESTTNNNHGENGAKPHA